MNKNGINDLEKTHKHLKELEKQFENQKLDYLIDYTGKMNNHNDYLKVLNILEAKTKYIEVVVLYNNHQNNLVENFKNDIILNKKVEVWWMSIHPSDNTLYRIKATRELFAHLREYETFCRSATLDNKEFWCEGTNFGYDDIAFYNNEDKILLCTCTHEGFISIDKDFMKEV